MDQDPGGRISLSGAIALVLLFAVIAKVAAWGAAAVQLGVRGIGFTDAIAIVTADPLTVALCQLLGVVVAVGAGALAAHGNGVRYRDAVGLHAVPLSFVAVTLVAGFSLQFVLHETALLLTHLGAPFSELPTSHATARALVSIAGIPQALGLAIAVVAIPAVGEELLFRGLLLPGLGRRYGPALGLLVSSLLFGAIHMRPVAFVYATLAGLVLGWTRMRTGSVLPSIALHGACNAVPFLLPARLVRIEGFNTVAVGVYHLPPALVTGSALAIGVSLILLHRATEPS